VALRYAKRNVDPLIIFGCGEADMAIANHGFGFEMTVGRRNCHR